MDLQTQFYTQLNKKQTIPNKTILVTTKYTYNNKTQTLMSLIKGLS